MKKLFIILVFTFVLVSCVQTPLTNTDSTLTKPANDAAITSDPNAQVVHAWTQGSNYVFSPNTVTAGTPVRIEFDLARLPGCSRAVTIPSANIVKIIQPEDNVIEFTPLTSGPVRVACTMNMYAGELIVQ